MRLLSVAFSTDDGENLNDGHFGKAEYFYIYKFSEEGENFLEKRKNVKFKEDKSLIHGDPEKAKTTASVLQNIDVTVGRKFGPNITRLRKKYVCVIARVKTIKEAVELVKHNIVKIEEEKNKGEARKHIVLTP